MKLILPIIENNALGKRQKNRDIRMFIKNNNIFIDTLERKKNVAW
jgi:hypothetical protein